MKTNITKHINALLAGCVGLLFEYVCTITDCPLQALWVMGILCLCFILLIHSLLDERRYMRAYERNCIVVWGHDFK